MIVTFKVEPKRGYAQLVEDTVNAVSVKAYRLTWKSDSPIGNLYASITWARGRRVRFTIETRDAYKHGSRTSSSGRHMRKASWEAHRDVMRALLKIDPDATIRTGFATYRGLSHFEATHLETGHKNVGSMIQPVTIRECSV